MSAPWSDPESDPVEDLRRWRKLFQQWPRIPVKCNEEECEFEALDGGAWCAVHSLDPPRRTGKVVTTANTTEKEQQQ